MGAQAEQLLQAASCPHRLQLTTGVIVYDFKAPSMLSISHAKQASSMCKAHHDHLWLQPAHILKKTRRCNLQLEAVNCHKTATPIACTQAITGSDNHHTRAVVLSHEMALNLMRQV
jgi:hypothetical protein